MPLLPVVLLFVLGIAVDIYIYRRLRHNRAPRGICIGSAVLAIIGALALLTVIFMPKRSGDEGYLASVMYILYCYFCIYVPKYVFALFSLLRKLLIRITRRSCKWVSFTGAGLSLVIFIAMLWGMIGGRFTTDVRDVEVAVDGLPASFDGLRIVQISDFHVGSYLEDTTFVSRVVEQVNSLHPDLIVFTGDLVNRRSRELYPHMSPLSRLHAPLGVISIMGNHDYGDYFDWPDEESHLADADSLKAMQGRLGWRMLNNEHLWLVRGNDSLAVIGVENIGDPPFPVYGNLRRAYPTPSDSLPKILLSHNPAHWVDSIAGHSDMNIALTLSGHTHAMQMKAFGLSPAALRYETWGGMYDDEQGRRLYVNIGLGEVAIPARIGSALPEITVITLKSR